jgi:hypothetical protein
MKLNVNFCVLSVFSTNNDVFGVIWVHKGFHYDTKVVQNDAKMRLNETKLHQKKPLICTNRHGILATENAEKTEFFDGKIRIIASFFSFLTTTIISICINCTVNFVFVKHLYEFLRIYFRNGE